MTRSEAIDMLRQICSYLTAGNPVWRSEPIREAIDMAIEALTEREASAERSGKWIPRDDRWRCTLCNGIAPKGIRWNFCPWCGAKMEMEENT